MMQIDNALDNGMRLVIQRAITDCGGTPAEVPVELALDQCQMVMVQACFQRAITLATERIDGTRQRTTDELVHALGLEMGWQS